MRPDKVLSMLGIAAKSGSVVSGEFSTEKAVKEGRAYLVIVAGDSSDNTKKMFSKKYFSSVGNNYGGAAASAVLAILPLTIIYLLLQDAFVQGQVDSAIK